jgi:hypothetical protein
MSNRPGTDPLTVFWIFAAAIVFIFFIL